MICVEYLIIVEKSNTFCDSEATFNKLLQVDSTLIVSKGVIKHKGVFSYNYTLKCGEIKGKEQRYFHMHFSIESEEDSRLIEFLDFLKTVRTIVAKLGSNPETLWDDISFHYSKISYGIIHKVENLMRKLIANFMLITIGVKWVDEAAPEEIKNVINKSKRSNYINVLHAVDFIDLAGFVLKPYSNVTTSEILNSIKKAATLEDLDFLKKLLPESNWNRYFSSLVNCDDTFLKKRWSDLYELRCKVAHNAIISKMDFDSIQLLASELEEKLDDALKKLHKVSVPDEEVENLVENAAENISYEISDFISMYRIFERNVNYKMIECKGPKMNVSGGVKYFEKIGLFCKEHVQDFQYIQRIRNNIIHPSDMIVSDVDLRIAMQSLYRLITVMEVPNRVLNEQIDSRERSLISRWWLHADRKSVIE